jgi:predicted transposase/invertase (TIGR01784 family)
MQGLFLNWSWTIAQFINHQFYFMRRDTIFYQLFKRFPMLLFQLLVLVPDRAEEYRFESVAVKESKFEIDGVFLPPESETTGVVYFCEVQFQKDPILYERLFCEALTYFYQNREQFSDWRAVLIYPSRSIEQTRLLPYEDLLHSHRSQRIYLNELGPMESLPLGIALMVLTTLDEEEAPQAARDLMARATQEISTPEIGRGIIEMIATVMTYKFVNLTRKEIEAMIGVTFQETRVYKDAKEEGRKEGQKEGRKEGRKEGQKEGRKEGQLTLVELLLTQKLGPVPKVQMSQIQKLSLEQLEKLAIALLSFEKKQDLKTWLDAQ